MIDYMTNRLTLEGPADAIRAAKALLRTTRGIQDMTFLDVAPPGLDGDPDDAARAAWGSDDPIVPQVAEDLEGRYVVRFDTGGGVPDKAALALTERVPELTVTIESVHPTIADEYAFRGSWKAGRGEFSAIEPSREHYLRVRPETEDWEMDELFARNPAY